MKKVKQQKINKLSRESELNFYFKLAMKDSHTRIEFIRKNKGDCPRQKIGVMIACIDPRNSKKVIIGFSLCHQGFDKFDKLDDGSVKKKDFGKFVAHRRAMKYSDLEAFMVVKEKMDKTMPQQIVYIPQTVHESLAKFVDGCYKYYKDKKFPEWVENYFPRDEDNAMGLFTKAFKKHDELRKKKVVVTNVSTGGRHG